MKIISKTSFVKHKQKILELQMF